MYGKGLKNKLYTITAQIILPILIILSTIDEIVRERELMDSIDDYAFLVLTLIAISIVKLSKGKMAKMAHMGLFGAALLTKIIALFLERDDFTAVDHDYAILGLMAIAALMSMGPLLWKKMRAKHQVAENFLGNS